MTQPLPHNPPKQSRSRRTLERIVRASLAILDEEGPEGLTVQAIVDRAGSSVGSFYARFEGKDELLEYLGERVWREAAERWDDTLKARDWQEVELPGLVEGSVRLLADAGRSRSTYLRALERAPGARDDAYLAFQGHVLAGIEELLLGRLHEIDHPEPRVAIPVGLRAVLGILDGPDHPGSPALDHEQRVEEAIQLLLGYLTRRDGPHPTGGEQVDFFDIWG